jgi:hypothetical protein
MDDILTSLEYRPTVRHTPYIPMPMGDNTKYITGQHRRKIAVYKTQKKKNGIPMYRHLTKRMQPFSESHLMLSIDIVPPPKTCSHMSMGVPTIFITRHASSGKMNR